MLMCAATLVFVACNNNKTNPDDKNDPDEPTQESVLVLDKTSITLEVDATETINANVESEWTSSDAEVASVAGNGKEAVVTAKKEGNTVITAKTKGGQVKTCVVLVKNAGGQQGGETVELKGKHVWPIALDGTTADAQVNKSKIVADFRPNDVDQFLYVWENGSVYEAGEGKGLNFHGNTDGYTALKVTNLGWAGAGFCLTDKGNGWQAAEALRAAVVANPDKFFLHLAMKSTDNYAHCFYMFGSEATKFVIGSKSVYDGPVYKDFTRDGSWAEFDIPMSSYASALASATCTAGVNVFVVLSEGVQGAELNMDAVYFYEVE